MDARELGRRRDREGSGLREEIICRESREERMKISGGKGNV